MSRHRLIIAYDGRPYAGWQIQPGRATVQEVLESALERIAKKSGLRIHGSGRTDTGVHALGQAAHFEVPESVRLSGEAWVRAFNANLPASIRVMHCRPVTTDFHARFDALGKTYQYRIFTRPVLPPLEAGLAAHIFKGLDTEALERAAEKLQGRHDFAGFAAFRGNEDGTEDTVRDLWTVRPEQRGEILTITFHGSGFLYKMVRLLTGALLRVAAGRENMVWLEDLLHRRVPGKCQHVAPAEGLYLVSVDYPEGIFVHDSHDSRSAAPD